MAEVEKTAQSANLSQDIREEIACVAQGTRDWFKARLGNITSSNVHFVMKAGKATKANPVAEVFSDTAKGYLYQVASERNLRPSVIEDDVQFDEYLNRTEKTSKAIRYGHECEDTARKVYELKFKREVAEVGFILHKDIERFGDSPDGIVLDENGKPDGCLEIKCPKPETFIRYKATIHNAEELKSEKPEYYWQCQSHCECNNLPWCDFVFFDNMQRNAFVCIRIERNDEDIALMKERVVLANAFIDGLL